MMPNIERRGKGGAEMEVIACSVHPFFQPGPLSLNSQPISMFLAYLAHLCIMYI